MGKSSFTFQLYDAVTVGICVINQAFEIVYWNDTMECWTGVTRDAVLGKNIMERFPNFDEELLKDRIGSVFKDGLPAIISSKLHPVFFPAIWPKDADLMHEIRISLISDGEEDIRYAVLTVEDVTDHTKLLFEQRMLYRKAIEEVRQRKIAEQKLVKSEQELKEAIIAKDKFFSIIAHDLKSPFASLLTYSDYMLSKKNAMGANVAGDLLQKVKRIAKSGYMLLDNLLGWSRIQTGRMRFEPELFDLDTIFSELEQLFALQSSEKKIELQFENEGLEIIADINMIRTILRNLISNAIKFSFPNSSVKIVAKQRDERSVIFSVADFGVGVPKDEIPFLFDIAKQNSTLGTNDELGTGLGLVLCKEFVDMHKGTINVVSGCEQGTIFSIEIPQSKESFS